jgi:hypothetical protein
VKVLITLTIRLELNFTQENQHKIEFGMYLDFRLSVFDMYFLVDLDDWLTVDRSITLVDLQIDVHIIYLLKSSTCFEHYPAHLQEVYVVIVYMQFFLNRCTGQSPAESDDTRGCMYIITT